MASSDKPRRTRLHRFAGRLLARYLDFVYRSSSKRFEPEDFDARIARYRPFILAMWHGQFLLVPKPICDKQPTRSMVARHGDTEILAVALEALGTGLIRGAGAGRRKRDRGGARALREAIRALEEGYSVGMIAEVPPGPPRRAAPGIVTLARLSGRPILPFAVATSRYVSFDTWSRLTLNLPFSRLAVVLGEPIHVARKGDAEALERARQAVEEGLNAVTRRAYELAGADESRSLPPSLRPPPPPGLSLRSYRLATRALTPLAPALLKHREARGKEDRARRSERLGEPSEKRPLGFLAWFHAASVGETNTVLAIIERLVANAPAVGILLTTGTVTSATLARSRAPEGVIHQYVPLDMPAFAQAFLTHWRPDLAVFVESEIWPNLLLEAADRGVPLVLVNGRLSPRSFRSWRRWRHAAHSLFGLFSLVLAQSARMAERFTRLGASNVLAVGNIKVDAPPPPVSPAELARLEGATEGRRLLLAASTHPHEEELIARAHALLRPQFPDLLTIIAPRHPERGPGIAERLGAQGLCIVRRARSGSGALPDSETDLYLADTMGELGTFYALCPLAFIGGSLVPHGGQNPIEAIKRGCAVISGPHYGNFREEYRALEAAGGALIVADFEALADAVRRLLKAPEARAQMCRRAEKAVAELSGALERTLEALAPYLPKGEGLKPKREGLKRAS